MVSSDVRNTPASRNSGSACARGWPGADMGGARKWTTGRLPRQPAQARGFRVRAAVRQPPARAARTAGCRRSCSSPPRSAYRSGTAQRRSASTPSLRVTTSVRSCCGRMSAGTAISYVSSPVMPSDCTVSVPLNCSGSTPMPTRLERWMRSKLLAITAFTPRSCVPFAAQSRERAGAVLLSTEHHRGCAVRDVLHGRVVDEHLLAGRLEQRDTAFLARAVRSGRDHQVLDAHIGEGAAHHHFMIAAARPVAVEVGLGHAVGGEPLAGRRIFLDRARRRNVIGGDRVAEDAQRACTANVDRSVPASWRSRRRRVAWRYTSTLASCRPGRRNRRPCPTAAWRWRGRCRGDDKWPDRAHVA